MFSSLRQLRRTALHSAWLFDGRCSPVSDSCAVQLCTQRRTTATVDEHENEWNGAAPDDQQYRATLKNVAGSSGGRFDRLWRCCLLSVPLGEQASGRKWIAQAWATWPEGASAPNGTMMCRGHGVSE